MRSRRSFYRKIGYLLAIGVLVWPLLYLSEPASSRAQGGHGGQLAQLRAKHGLSEAQLGEIDPTSETIKLATFGLRGVAANLLWGKANEYFKKKDWTNLSATLQQITKLEPHFISVWQFQAWNLSYNVSAQFDGFRGRYQWVIKGIDFLDEGIRYNEREPKLHWDKGWVTAQKIGRADEKVQFRRLFKEDDDFHGARPPEERDNWLVGKESFADAEALVEAGASLKKKSPVLFYSEWPMCQMNYAENLEEDGIFEEKAGLAWDKAGREWNAYGNREIPTTFGDVIRLNDRAMYNQRAKTLRAQLDQMSGDLREQIAKEREDELDSEERLALNTPSEERTMREHELVAEIHRKLQVTHEDVAERLTGAERGRGLEIAEQLTEAERLSGIIARYQQIVNYEFWERRAAVEQTREALEARKLVYEGRRLFTEETSLLAAIEAVENGLKKWRQVYDMPQFKEYLLDDRNIGRDVIEAIGLYRRILDAADRPFPEDFVLQDVLERHGNMMNDL